MEFLMLVLCVIPAAVTSITIAHNGNSPQTKMIGGIMVDVQKDYIPMSREENTTKSNNEKSKNNDVNSTKLGINERYRRLIPYMTFYYANDLATPPPVNTKSVVVEKAEIVESGEYGHSNSRQPKKSIYNPQRNIPRYQGNRLTHYNIASSNPTRVYYKVGVPVHHSQRKVSHNYNPLLPGYNVLAINDYDSGKFAQKQTVKFPVDFPSSTRKPSSTLYNNEDVQYYLPDKENVSKYKLVPYEHTPPVKVEPQYENFFDVITKPADESVWVPKTQVSVRPRPLRPLSRPYIYDSIGIQPVRKPLATVAEPYYEKQRPQTAVGQPISEDGFEPIIAPSEYTTETPIYTMTLPEASLSEFAIKKQYPEQIQTEPVALINNNPKYYQYVVEQPVLPPQRTSSNTVGLKSILNSLQVHKSVPKPITRENVTLSIKALLQVLNNLKQQNTVQTPGLSLPKPTVVPNVADEIIKPRIAVAQNPVINDAELHEETYLARVNTPSQHLDDLLSGGRISQQFPLPVTSDDEGGTPGQPGKDYPILTTIPPTSFDCKTQRYKGFFADTETRCQVWHYCDLNGGQASFLCPNGTIFSQAALTCDWWFNVRCASAKQLYVLNESLYKYILPHSPKFPEDYSGPLVDKYLTLKFKEMEEEFKKTKNKQTDTDKNESDDNEDSSETSDGDESDSSSSEQSDQSQNTVREASVIVESLGTSGNVERLHD